MKKLIYSFATVLLGLTSCVSFDDPTTENYGAGPSIDVTVSSGIVTDSAFTVSITPAEGALYYAYAIGQSDAPEAVDSATLYKGGYGNAVVKVADQPTTFFTIEDADPNTTYWVYAVAGNDKGIIGNMVVKSITTTDGELPEAMTIQRDADNAALMLGFSENIVRGEGAVTAKYYKEWDIMNPVDVPEENIMVEVAGNAAVFAADGVPAGAYLCFSYAAGAFKDLKGNACGALNSGLDMEKGRFVGAYLRLTNQPFAIESSYVTAPLDGELISSTEDFEGKITFPFDVYRNDETVEDGDVIVSFVNSVKTTAYNLNPSQWSVNGNEFTFTLPAQPEVGDQIVLAIGGNPNTAFLSTADWKYLPLSKENFMGKFGVQYISYFDDNKEVAWLGTISIEDDDLGSNGLLIKDLYLEGSELAGAYDLSAGKMYMPDMQVLGFFEDEGTVYGLAFVTADGTDEATFTLNADGTMTADGMWGVYAFDENFQEEIGWFDVAEATEFVPLDGGARKASARAKSFKAAKKGVKIQKKNFSRDLNKRVRK